jgi:hypothetical protein
LIKNDGASGGFLTSGSASGNDGSPEGDARMNARYEKRKAKLNAVSAAG